MCISARIGKYLSKGGCDGENLGRRETADPSNKCSRALPNKCMRYIITYSLFLFKFRREKEFRSARTRYSAMLEGQCEQLFDRILSAAYDKAMLK